MSCCCFNWRHTDACNHSAPACTNSNTSHWQYQQGWLFIPTKLTMPTSMWMWIPRPLPTSIFNNINFQNITWQLLPLDCNSSICLATHLPHSSHHFPHHHAYHHQPHHTHLLLHHIYPHMLQSLQRIKVSFFIIFLIPRFQQFSQETPLLRPAL